MFLAPEYGINLEVHLALVIEGERQSTAVVGDELALQHVVAANHGTEVFRILEEVRSLESILWIFRAKDPLEVIDFRIMFLEEIGQEAFIREYLDVSHVGCKDFRILEHDSAQRVESPDVKNSTAVRFSEFLKIQNVI